MEGSKWNERNFNWVSTSYQFMKLGVNADAFFEFSLESDASNSTRNLLTVIFFYHI